MCGKPDAPVSSELVDQAAVNVEALPGDEGGFIAGKEDDRPGDVIGDTGTFDQLDGGRPFVDEVLSLGRHGRRRLDLSRADVVGPNAERTAFLGEIPGEGLEGGLGRW